MVTIAIEEQELIETTIKECKECFVGMIDSEGMPYVIPMNFGYKDGIIYLHSGSKGCSVRFLEKNPNVCITFCTPTKIVHQNQNVACSYGIQGSSVMCRGKVTFVEDHDQKVEALNIMMRQYTEMTFKYSEPSVRNVKVWKVEVKDMSGRIFGIPYKESYKYT